MCSIKLIIKYLTLNVFNIKHSQSILTRARILPEINSDLLTYLGRKCVKNTRQAGHPFDHRMSNTCFFHRRPMVDHCPPKRFVL